MLDRSVAPEILNAVSFQLNLPDCSRTTLANGVPLFMVDAGVEEVVQIDFVFEAGNVHEPHNIIAAATNYLIKNGTTQRKAFDISEQIDFYGAFLNRSCQQDTAIVTLHTLSKHLPSLLPVLVDIFTDSLFPQEELDIFVQNSKMKLSVNLMRCDFVAGREIDALLYGAQHPYGRYTKAEDLDGLTRDQLLDFYSTYYKKGKLAIFASGKLPPGIAEQLNQAFGFLSFQPFNPQVQAMEASYEPPANRIVRIENDANGVQGAIRIARQFPNRHHPDFLKVQVLNNVFGGFFGSRLMSNIREDKGYTYGIHSYIHNHTGPSAWLVSTEAGRDVCEATIHEVYKEMEILRNGFIDDEELLLVRNYMIGSMLSSLDGPFHIMGRWKNYFLHGFTDPQDYFSKAVETIKTVPAEELHVLANKYLQPEFFYEMVVV